MSVIAVENLVKYFGSTRAVDGISFTVEKGEIFGFLGPNGAGKTTTIRCMMDFIRPTSGSVTLLDKNAQLDSVSLKERVGYLSGSIDLHDKWTGEEHLAFARRMDGTNDRSIELAERLDFDPRIKTKNLSSGNRQKLGVILALMSKPELLIMDEPTNALDPLLQNEVYSLIQEATKRGTTIFMSSHNLAEVDKICTRVGIIREGKLVATESIRALKEKHLYTIRMHVKKSMNLSQIKLEGAEVLHQHNHSITFRVKGDINPVVQKLATFDLKDVEIEHAPLDDIFLEFYHS